MKKISIIVPTKSRPKNIQNLCNSINETVQYRNFEVVFFVDKTDTITKDFFKQQMEDNTLNCPIKVVFGEEEKLTRMYNRAYEKSNGEIIMYAADDLYFRTKGWDVLVRDEFKRYKNDIALVFGYDLIQPPGTIATHGFVSRRSIEELGYLHPPVFGYNYTDNYLTEIYRQIDRLAYIPVCFEHRHWGVGKAEYDETYRTGSDAPHQDSIESWEDKTQLNVDIEKLRPLTV